MINVRNIHKDYGRTTVLHDVTFSAQPAAVTGLVGPNGAGKSTLLRILAGVTTPDAGSTTIGDADLRRAPLPSSLLGVFLSAEIIPGSMTGESYLAYLNDTQGFLRSRVGDLLRMVGLEAAAHRRVRHYSLGMRQRLGVAAALIGDPETLILDEPVNGLDPAGIVWFREFLSDRASRGTTVLVSSHHMSELSMVADAIVLLDQGRVVRSGAIESFVSEGSTRVYVESPDLQSLRRVLTTNGHAVSAHGAGLVVTDAQPHEIGRIAFLEGPGLSELRVISRTLEETYFDSVGELSAMGSTGKGRA